MVSYRNSTTISITYNSLTIFLTDTALPPVKFIKSGKQKFQLHVKWSEKLPRWNCSDLLAETLQQHADEGDFQTAVCILLVLGDRRRYLTKTAQLDEVTQEQWLLTYIDMLSRFKLWNIATEVSIFSILYILSKKF